MIPPWMMNPLFALAAGPLSAAAARMVLGEEPLDHEKALLNRCQRGIDEAGVLMGALAEFDTAKPFTLYPSLKEAHGRLKNWRRENQIRTGKEVLPPSSPSHLMVGLWLRHKFGGEYHFAAMVDTQVEWALKKLLPEATLRQEVKNPFDGSPATTDLLPAFLVKDPQYKKAVIRAWVLPSPEWVLVELAPPDEAKVSSNLYNYMLCHKGEGEVEDQGRLGEGMEVVGKWLADYVWDCNQSRIEGYWCAGLQLCKDLGKGEQSASAFSGFNPPGLVFKKRGPPSPQFKGEGAVFIDQWRAFMEAGHRRAVLLYGPPGGGKTTLLLDAMQSLGERRIDLRSWNRSEVLLDILRGLDPDVLLLEDLDRWDEDHLAHVVMPMLESKPAKLIIATCNDFRKLPQALRRPGRFDQMIHIQAPDREGRRAIMIKHAATLQAAIPEEVQDQLLAWSEGMTGAFLCEMVNRGVVLGWEKNLIFPPLDATHLQAMPGNGEDGAGEDRPRPPSLRPLLHTNPEDL